MDSDLKTSVFLPDMVKSSFVKPPNAARSSSSGITILEVLLAVSIAGGLISLLVPALTRQVALGEQSNRLTAVEAVVSSDLNWFSNYARVWKLKSGSYSVTKAVTKTSSYTLAGAATYEPPEAECKQAADSASGLAKKLLDDGADLYTKSTASALKAYDPPNPLASPTTIKVTSGGVTGLNVIRTVTPVGNMIRVFYKLDFADAAAKADLRNNGLNFSREAAFLVEASAWCDRIP
ncbi:Tfp pilus assembly protein FimT/FimU [Vulcanococcus limneticus]|uniref:pilus assembly FimT family protein n=1 Tax=Vulcanococcus limneticus TaxID=2170428 RepID=UPI00398C1269